MTSKETVPATDADIWCAMLLTYALYNQVAKNGTGESEGVSEEHECVASLRQTIISRRRIQTDMLCRCFLYLIIIVPGAKSTDLNIRHSHISLSTPGFEFMPIDTQALLLLDTMSATTVLDCAYLCQQTAGCRIFNHDLSNTRCRLYEGDVDTTGSIVASSSSSTVCGSIGLDAKDFLDYGSPCSTCQNSRYLRCVNGACGCQLHTYFDGSICRSEKLRGAACSNDNECRRDANLTCVWNTICESEC